MASLQERRLAEFVDRDTEMAEFIQMLEQQESRIMVLSGGGGLGKSSLIARMMHECAQRKIYKAEVVSTDTRNKHYLEIMRKLREDIGQIKGLEYFSPFTDLVNYYTEQRYELNVNVTGLRQSQISAGEGLSVSDNSSVGDVAGVIIKDLMLTAPREDLAVPEAERMTQLTDAFLQCLDNATKDDRWVIFLDATEKLDKDTDQWLWDQLLSPVLDDEIPNVSFVISGRNEPELKRDWSFCVTVETLKPLQFEHIALYLEKRGLPSEDILIDAILEGSGGVPYEIASMVDGILRRQRRRAG